MSNRITKDCLTEALFLLMDKKNIQDITVKELVQKAGVARATFYRNFTSIEDILDEYLKDITCALFGDERMNQYNVRKCVYNVFVNVKQRRQFFTILKKQRLDAKLSQIFYEVTFAQIKSLQVLHNRYQPYFFAGASMAIILAWIDHDFSESEEEMTEIFMRSLSGYMDIKEADIR